MRTNSTFIATARRAVLEKPPGKAFFFILNAIHRTRPDSGPGLQSRLQTQKCTISNTEMHMSHAKLNLELRIQPRTKRRRI